VSTEAKGQNQSRNRPDRERNQNEKYGERNDSPLQSTRDHQGPIARIEFQEATHYRRVVDESESEETLAEGDFTG